LEFRLQVRIHYDQVAEALTLPRTAMFRSLRGAWQIMLVQDGVTGLRTVEVGLMNDDQAEITDGLAENDLVIARPSREITADLGVEALLVE
jgi:multidrug efflux pump subunit AcrA (membrane-fusion protein)